MRRPPFPRIAAAVAASAVVGGVLAGADTPPGAWAQSSSTLEGIQDRLAEVRADRAQIEERITQATLAYEALQTTISDLEVEREELMRERVVLQEELDELDELVVFRIRETFKHGTALDPIAVFLGSEDPTVAFSKAQTIQRVVSADQASSEDLAAVRTRVVAADRRLAEQGEEMELALDEQTAIGERLQTEFAALEALEADLTAEERAEVERLEQQRRERQRRAREEAQRREAAERDAARAAGAGGSGSSGRASSSSSSASAPAPASGGGMACPLDQPRSFIDSWGYARSGGRSHRGTDIMGPRGIPVRAITSGTWNIQRSGPSAGLWAILRGDNGDHYWYMHLDSHTVGSGARVSAGQQVGTNGSTGNATAGAEHVHFELHPGGGSAVNPYALLRSVC